MGTEAHADPGGPGERYPAAMAQSAVNYLRSAEPGTRVVARYKIAGGFTDALGYLLACDDRVCSIVTRRGHVVVELANVVAAKQVPEPPVRKSTD